MAVYWGPVPVGSRVSEAWTVRRERDIDIERDKERLGNNSVVRERRENRGEKRLYSLVYTGDQ